MVPPSFPSLFKSLPSIPSNTHIHARAFAKEVRNFKQADEVFSSVRCKDISIPGKSEGESILLLLKKRGEGNKEVRVISVLLFDLGACVEVGKGSP